MESTAIQRGGKNHQQTSTTPLLPLTHLFPLVPFWCPGLRVRVVIISVVVVVVVVVVRGGGHQSPQFLERLAETRLLPPPPQLLLHRRARVEGAPLGTVPGSGTRGLERVPAPLTSRPVAVPLLASLGAAGRPSVTAGRPLATSLGRPKRGHVLLATCSRRSGRTEGKINKIERGDRWTEEARGNKHEPSLCGV